MPQLCVIPGDGIGQEVIPAALLIMHAAIPDLQTITAQAGWNCFLQTGSSLPETTLQAVRDCGAGLFGAVSSPSHKVPGYRSTILQLRQELDLYANVRPIRSFPGVSTRDDIDLIVIRENTEGLYSGIERTDGETAVAERVITRRASERIARRAAEMARLGNRQQVTIVHKATILPLSDGLFRETVRAVLQGMQPSLLLDELLVDVAALKLLAEPQHFDLIVTTNLFGDILSDAASYWGGGLGMAPSLNWGEGVGVAEPVHGSAPDIAGQGTANPIAAILSAALLARYIWGHEEAALAIESAVHKTLAADLDLSAGTAAITDSILNRLDC